MMDQYHPAAKTLQGVHKFILRIRVSVCTFYAAASDRNKEGNESLPV
jgi:hypothetical protein